MALFGQMYQRDKSDSWPDAIAKVARGFARNPHLRGLTPSVLYLNPSDYAALGCPETIRAGNYTVPVVADTPPGRGYLWLCVEETPADEFRREKAEFAQQVKAAVI